MWLVAVASATLPTQESPVRAGLSFTPVYRLALTGRQYVVPFIIRSADVQQPLIDAINITASLAWNVEHMDSNLPIVASIKNTLNNFDREFHGLFHDLNKFLHYTLNTDPNRSNAASILRKRRGLINAFGSLSNVLFGTATQAQVDAINSRIDEIHQLSEQERVMLNVHSKTLNITISHMHNMDSAFHRLTNAVNTTNKILRHFSTLTLQLEGEHQLHQALLDLEFAFGHISNHVLNLKLGLQALLQTYITPSISSDDKLLEILTEAAARPPGLLFPATTEYLGLHRDLIRVSSKTTAVSGTRNFYFTISLRGDPTDTFDVLRIDSLPFPLPNSTLFARHESASIYISLTEDRRSHFLLSNLDHCYKHDKLLVCPPTSPVYEASHVASCESAAFLHLPSMYKLCNTRVLTTFPQFLLKVRVFGLIQSLPLSLLLSNA